ncbi:MAG: hypothetical protein ABIP90_04270 [Vicinamibacterales bacterium]
MTRNVGLTLTLSALLTIATPVAAQQAPAPTPAPTPSATPVVAVPAEPLQDPAAKKSAWKNGRPLTIRYLRPQDKRGINVFETSKEPGAPDVGMRVDFGAAFTTQVQNLSHSNTATPTLVNGVDTNKLADIGFGFNNSTANLYLHAQLAPGIRVALTSYLSSRHHNETWVKDGYLQIDESPFGFVPFKAIMQYVTLRFGHFEINYGDAHFRRSDNGNAVYNPFVGNYIMDAFTTEIGAEVYVKAKSIIAMGAVTGGEIRGTVLSPGQRGPSYVAKLGFDRQVTPGVRLRLTGSMYHTAKSLSNTLYGGDRAGSRYYYAVENAASTESAQFTSGYINPGFKNQVTAVQMNPFVKVRGLEVFGVIERARGKAASEVTTRTWHQYAVDGVYRFFDDERLFVGARYNRADGTLLNVAGDVGARRWQVGAGWFVLPGLLVKAEYVNQKFTGYPTANIKNGGRFKGLMLEGIVAF